MAGTPIADVTLAMLIADCDAAHVRVEAARNRLRDYLVECDRLPAIPTAPTADWPTSPDHPDLITPRDAATRALRDEDTIRRWAKSDGIGRRYAGRWRISIDRLARLTEIKSGRCG